MLTNEEIIERLSKLDDDHYLWLAPNRIVELLAEVSPGNDPLLTKFAEVSSRIHNKICDEKHLLGLAEELFDSEQYEQAMEQIERCVNIHGESPRSSGIRSAIETIWYLSEE
jgi:hypothetical protein